MTTAANRASGFSTTFTHSLVRPPGAAFVDGLRRVDLGVPSLAEALGQHRGYCAALREAGVDIVTLPDDPRFPDGCFVEDTAVIAGRAAMLSRPGAPSRRGEVAAIRKALAELGFVLSSIEAPGTLDGGDVCVAGERALIGLSARTNEAGAQQLGAWFAGRGIAARTIDIRALDSILHLKSGLAWLGEGRIAVIDALARHPALADFEPVVLDRDEAYAANAVRINDCVLIAAGHPRFAGRLAVLGLRTVAIEMGEFARLDGGLSCLSLRW